MVGNVYLCIKKDKLFLSVYVDDFKMVGDKKNIAKMWKTLSEKLELEPPTPMNGHVYLGCGQTDYTPSESQVEDASRMFHNLCGMTGKGRPSATTSVVVNDSCGAGGITTTLPRAYQYDMSGHTEKCVEMYLELTNKDESSLKLVATPCIDDHLLAPEDFEAKGEIAPVAARIVLKAL